MFAVFATFWLLLAGCGGIADGSDEEAGGGGAEEDPYQEYLYTDDPDFRVPILTVEMPKPIVLTPRDTFRLNCGGDAFTDKNGNEWERSDYYIAGGYGMVNGIAHHTPEYDAADSDLYLYYSNVYANPLEARFDNIIPGKYRVKLYMMEVYWNDGDPSARVYDIRINDKLYKRDVCPSRQVGKWHALEYVFVVEIAQGDSLFISMPASVDNAILSGIEITPAAAAATLTPSI